MAKNSISASELRVVSPARNPSNAEAPCPFRCSSPVTVEPRPFATCPRTVAALRPLVYSSRAASDSSTQHFQQYMLRVRYADGDSLCFFRCQLQRFLALRRQRHFDGSGDSSPLYDLLRSSRSNPAQGVPSRYKDCRIAWPQSERRIRRRAFSVQRSNMANECQ